MKRLGLSVSNLSAEQRDKIRGIVEQSFAEAHQRNGAHFKEVGEIFRRMNTQITGHLTPEQKEERKLVDAAAIEPDKAKQVELYTKFQQAMVDEANLLVLFQPIYKIGAFYRF